MDDLDKKTYELRTICRDCIFALYDEHYTEQIGCEVNRLEKFEKLGKVKTLEDEETGLKYAEINSICNLCRDSSWASAYENPKEKVLEQTKVKVGFVVLAKDDDDTLLITLNNLIFQSQKPDKIIIAFYARTISSKNILDYLFDNARPRDIEFELINMFDRSDDGYIIDAAVKKLRSQYYTVCSYDKCIVIDFIEKFNRAINEELKQISMVLPSEGFHGLIVQRKLHDLIGGNNNVSIIDKIKTLAKNQNLEKMILQHKDIYE